MNATARIYRSVMIRAVLGEDGSEARVADIELLNRVAEHLAECEEAKSILRNKGYGQAGTSVADVARAVPDNVGEMLNRLFKPKSQLELDRLFNTRQAQ